MSSRPSVLRGIAAAVAVVGGAYAIVANPRGAFDSLLAAPLVSLATGLVLSPAVYQRLKRRAPADDPSYAGYAYVECPECRHIVPMSAQRCPLCGAELFAPWTNASRHA